MGGRNVKKEDVVVNNEGQAGPGRFLVVGNNSFSSREGQTPEDAMVSVMESGGKRKIRYDSSLLERFQDLSLPVLWTKTNVNVKCIPSVQLT